MKHLGLILIAAALLTGMSCSQKEQTIKIGFCGPLTGDAANYGKLMTQAIKMAVEERNARGGIAGMKVELIAEDDQGKVEKANAAIEKLSSVDKIYGLVGAVFSSCALAIAPKAQKEKIVMISPSSTHKALTSKGNFIFRDVLSDQLQALVFAKYTYEVLKIKKVAILYLKNDYSQGLAEDFKAEFEKEGGTITAMEASQQGDKDFNTQLTKIKGTSPEALYMPDYVAEIAQILEQSKQLGLKVKMLSSDGYSNPDIFNLAGKLAEGVIFANSAEDIGEVSPARKAFEDAYQAKWGEKPDSFSLNSYDAANLLFDAMEKVYADTKKLPLDRDMIRANVAGVKDYNGVSGIINFMPDKGDAIKNVGIFLAQNKAFKQTAVYKIDSDKLVEIKK